MLGRERISFLLAELLDFIFVSGALSQHFFQELSPRSQVRR
jgi:hypothetical protein